MTALQQKRNLRLRGQVDQLLGENEELHKKASDWKVCTQVQVLDALATFKALAYRWHMTRGIPEPT